MFFLLGCLLYNYATMKEMLKKLIDAESTDEKGELAADRV